MIFSNRHYCNICQVKRPICQLLRLFHPFAAFRRGIQVWDNKTLNTTDTLLIKMEQILVFSNFWNWGFFLWKSIKHQKHDFWVFMSIGSPYQRFIFIEKKARFDICWNFQAFIPVLKNKHFLLKRHFYKKTVHRLEQDDYWIKTWALSSMESY